MEASKWWWLHAGVCITGCARQSHPTHFVQLWLWNIKVKGWIFYTIFSSLGRYYYKIKQKLLFFIWFHYVDIKSWNLDMEFQRGDMILSTITTFIIDPPFKWLKYLKCKNVKKIVKNVKCEDIKFFFYPEASWGVTKTHHRFGLYIARNFLCNQLLSLLSFFNRGPTNY